MLANIGRPTTMRKSTNATRKRMSVPALISHVYAIAGSIKFRYRYRRDVSRDNSNSIINSKYADKSRDVHKGRDACKVGRPATA